MASWKTIKTALKRNEFAFRLLHPLHKVYRMAFMWTAQRRLGVNPRKVVFSCFDYSSYCDNTRYISEKLHELRPDCEIVWLFRPECIDSVKTPDYVKRATPISRKGLEEQASAGFWVNNFRNTESIYLNAKKQYYIQTWHGDRGFKRIACDNEKLPFEVPRLESKCAMMIAGSRFGAGTYRTAFHFKGEILMDGCPRNDVLLRNDPREAAAIRERLGVPMDAKLLMYAPTYRDTHQYGRQGVALDVSRTLDHLEKTTGSRWLCLYRAHYLNTGLDIRADDRLVDASGYPEMAELLLVTNMLITDYSSCGGDFALLRRPLFLYHADAEEYLRECRSFYFDVEASPFLIAHSQAELEALIDETDAQKARENCEALDRFFGTTETGHATEAVCRFIIDRMP